MRSARQLEGERGKGGGREGGEEEEGASRGKGGGGGGGGRKPGKGKRGADLLHSKVAVTPVSRLVMRTQARCQAERGPSPSCPTSTCNAITHFTQAYILQLTFASNRAPHVRSSKAVLQVVNCALISCGMLASQQ